MPGYQVDDVDEPERNRQGEPARKPSICVRANVVTRGDATRTGNAPTSNATTRPVESRRSWSSLLARHQSCGDEGAREEDVYEVLRRIADCEAAGVATIQGVPHPVEAGMHGAVCIARLWSVWGSYECCVASHEANPIDLPMSNGR